MKWLGPVLSCVLLTACASASAERRAADERLEIWRQAQEALTIGQLARADTLLGILVREHGSTEAGRESLFYLGAIRLDPRNPDWSSKLAETALELYLATDAADSRQVRRPEARTLYELARQLNMPADERVPALQVEPRVVTLEVPQRVAPAGQVESLRTENSRLRQELAAKEQQIQQKDDELERIRKTLAPPGTR